MSALDEAPRGADLPPAYVESRDRWLEERLPKFVQGPVGIACLRDMHATLSRVLESVATEDEAITRVRKKWCSKPCCKGKPMEQRHGPWLVVEWWDKSSGKGRWRALDRSDRNAWTRALLRAYQEQAGRDVATPADVEGELPRDATPDDLEAIRRVLRA